MKITRLIAIALISLVVGLCVFHFLLTGMPFPMRVVEKLHNPRQVAEITAAGFVTADGGLVKVRHVSEIPTNSSVVRAAVGDGIEIDPEGRTYGLLKIWHWCGNDPVRYHIARVDLSNLILAAGGRPDPAIPKEILEMLIPKDRVVRYGAHGLNISDFYSMRHISETIETETEQQGGGYSPPAARSVQPTP